MLLPVIEKGCTVQFWMIDVKITGIIKPFLIYTKIIKEVNTNVNKNNKRL